MTLDYPISYIIPFPILLSFMILVYVSIHLCVLNEHEFEHASNNFNFTELQYFHLIPVYLFIISRVKICSLTEICVNLKLIISCCTF